MASSEEGIKVIVVGDGSVGKTCLLRRFVRGDFSDQYRRTIGAEFMEKDVFLRSTNTTVKLMLWDTAGQEVFNALTQAYYRGSGAAIIAFSAVNRESFVHVESWKKKIEEVCGPVATVVCQTKMDLSHEAAVTNVEVEQLAERLKVPLFRVSTKDDFNVTQLFEFTAQLSLTGESETAAATDMGAAAPSSAILTEAKDAPATAPAEITAPVEVATSESAPAAAEAKATVSPPPPSPPAVSSKAKPTAQAAPAESTPAAGSPRRPLKHSPQSQVKLRENPRSSTKRKKKSKCTLM